jgi:nitrogen fixation/metabolism regulation signal transduction histidine kinase
VSLSQLEEMQLQENEHLREFAQHIQEEFERFEKEGDGETASTDKTYWEASFELHAPSSEFEASSTSPQQVTLLARGAIMPNQARLVVFDDISAIISAQRSRAWAEVARRLAHEIKNPLTPIQLSAERLEMKLTGKLPAPEQTILVRSVKTIVEQVAAMQRLVNEFRDYARLPLADLKPLNLNELVRDVLQLYGGENALVPVQANLHADGPLIMGDAQQLRQVIHNLLQNAQDACVGQSLASVEIATQWQESARRVRLVVRDSGPGFSQQILQRAFEPYVTTKSKGTGLGLAVVKKIVEDHHARIDIKNREEAGAVVGAQVSLSFDTVQSSTAS